MLPFLFSLGTNELVGIKATCPVTCSQCMRSKWSSNDWLDFQGFIDSSLIYQKLTPRQWLLQLHRTKRKYQSNFHLIWSTFNFLRDIWLEINFLSKSWSEFESLSALHRWNKPPITASAIIFFIFILFLVEFLKYLVWMLQSLCITVQAKFSCNWLPHFCVLFARKNSKLVAQNYWRSVASSMIVYFSALAGRGTDFPSWRDEVAGVLSDSRIRHFGRKCLPRGWIVS